MSASASKPLFEEYKKIDRPTLVIIGAQDEYTEHVGGADKAMKLFMKHTSNAMLKKTDFVTVPDADHGFSGYRRRLRQTDGGLAGI